MTMPEPAPRLKRIRIRNYRSIENWIDIRLPTGAPLVIIGENNAGKSNIIRALTLLLGEIWPGNYQPSDHEFYGRSPEGIAIQIALEVDGVVCPKGCSGSVSRFSWKYARDDDKPCEYTYEADCDHTYMSNEVRGQLMCMTVGVDRDLSWQLSYGSKWTTLSKVMRRFHERLTDNDQRVTKLKTFYDDLVKTFYEVPEFKNFADSLKASVDEFGGNMPYGLGIDFSAYDASNYFQSLRVFPQLGGSPRSYEELGTGQEQVLAIAFSYSYARAFGGDGLVLAVEEPEAHLHPLAQVWIARKLRELAEAGAQVVITTHSPYFLNLSRPGTTVLVRKADENSSTSVVQLTPQQLADAVKSTGAAHTTTSANIGPFYENSATDEIKAGMFARACVLVEGPTESLGLSTLLQRVGTDLVKLGIAIVPVEGISNLAKWVRYYGAHGIPVYPIFDSDSTKTGKEKQSGDLARADLWQALRLDPDKDWTGMTVGPIGACDDFAAFDPDYEGALRQVFGADYATLEAEARESLGSAKPLVARYVANHLPKPSDDPAEVAWVRIRALGEKIEQLIRSR